METRRCRACGESTARQSLLSFLLTDEKCPHCSCTMPWPGVGKRIIWFGVITVIGIVLFCYWFVLKLGSFENYL